MFHELLFSVIKCYLFIFRIIVWYFVWYAKLCECRILPSFRIPTYWNQHWSTNIKKTFSNRKIRMRLSKAESWSWMFLKVYNERYYLKIYKNHYPDILKDFLPNHIIYTTYASDKKWMVILTLLKQTIKRQMGNIRFNIKLEHWVP